MHKITKSITKAEAIQRLRNAGYKREAHQLQDWRDKNGRNWGWDGWIRSVHQHVVLTVWALSIR